MDYPGHTEETPRSAQGFARPHELDLARHDGGGGFWATLRHVNRAGSVVKLELEDGDGRPIHAEATREHFEALDVAPGDPLYVTPRQVRIFVEGS